MGGVGTFTRQNRTLYVGRIKETGTGPETEEVVKRHFKEWGQIEKSAYHFLLVFTIHANILDPYPKFVSSNTGASPS